MTGTNPETDHHEHFQHAPDQTILEKGLIKGYSKIEPYTNQLLIGAVVVAVVLVAGIVWFRSSNMRQAAGWEQFQESRAPEDFLALAEKYPNSSVGQWARLRAGRQFVFEGLSQALTNRAASDAALEKARDAFDSLLKESVSPELREEALYGMATCLEALSDGDTQPAIDAYETLLNEFPQTPHRRWAEARIAELKTKRAQSFYAWFRKQDPKPADRPGPKDIPKLDPLIEGLESAKEAESDQTTSGSSAPTLPDGAAMPNKPDLPAPEFPDQADQPKSLSSGGTDEDAPARAPSAPPAAEADAPQQEAPKSEPDAEPAADKPASQESAPAEQSTEDQPTTSK